MALTPLPLALVLTLALATFARGQSAAPAAPSPDALSADWWSYFSKPDDLGASELRDRIGRFLERIESQPDREKLRGLLDRYLEAHTTEDPPPQSPPAHQLSYRLDEALEKYQSWQKRSREILNLREEIDWQQSVQTQDQRIQSQRRSDYLESAPLAPERLQKGIALIASRIELETRALKLSEQKRRLAAEEAEEEHLKKELEIISSRLRFDNESLSRWKERREEAGEALRQAREESKEPSPPENAGADPRRAILEEETHSIELAAAEVEATRAELGVLLNEIGSLSTEEIPGGDLRKRIASFRESIQETSARIERSGRTIQRVQSAVVDQLATNTDDPGLGENLRETRNLASAAEESLRKLKVANETVGFMTGLVEAKLREGQGWIGQASIQTQSTALRILSGVGKALRRPLFEINDTPVNVLGLLRVLMIIVVAWWVSKALRHALDSFGSRQKRVSKTSLYTVERIVHYVILTLGFLVALSSIGLDLTKFALFASALGVGLGFGLQNFVSNFVAGLIILFERSLTVGDFVELESGVTGEVREINMRSTLITTNDNVDILVPNSEFVGGRVTNWTLREVFRRIHVPFGVAYGSDKELVRSAVLEAAERVPWTLIDSPRRKPQVWLVSFGDSSLDFELIVWLTSEAVKRPLAVHSDYMWEIETSLKEHGIEIPFPQRDLHLRSGFPEIPSK